MICYNCKSQIDDDSAFCDQCGKRVYICPSCRIPGKGEGKRCGKCGTPLVAAGALTGASVANPQGPSPRPGGSTPPPPQGPTKLRNREMNLTLDLMDGALIGRVEGPYARLLGPLKFISARHATLRKDGDRWIIADVGSRNGTAVNGQWCYSPLPFAKGDTVRLGNSYDFIAE